MTGSGWVFNDSISRHLHPTLPARTRGPPPESAAPSKTILKLTSKEHGKFVSRKFIAADSVVEGGDAAAGVRGEIREERARETGREFHPGRWEAEGDAGHD